VTTLAVTRRFDLTDEQWARLESLLPVPVRSGRPPLWTKRQLIDGIRWRVRVGRAMAGRPECYGSWRAVYSLFRRWQRAGVWAAIVTGLQTRADASGRIIWEISVDSMITGRTSTPPAHAPLLRKSPRAASRLSRQITLWDAPHGGFTTKIHLACEQGQNVMSLLLTAGQRGDSPQFQNVLDKINVPRMYDKPPSATRPASTSPSSTTGC
jgi:transposase